MEKKMNARKKAQRAARLRKQRNRRIALTLCLMFVVAFASIGGTIAWLTAESGEVTNTFTVGDITIALNEHDYDPDTNKLNDTVVQENKDYKVIPGVNLPKDPYITVNAGSEACWLFVQITEANWNNGMTYSLDGAVQSGAATKWEKLTGVDGVNNVWYIKVNATTANTDFNILEGKTITVANTIKKGDINNSAKPTLTFTAYACQQAGVDTAAAAWANCSTAA